MPNPTLDPAVSQLGAQIREMQARIQQLERNQRASYNLANSSIDGGAVTVNDDNGNPTLILGLQPDGSYAASGTGGAVPLQAPSDPIVQAAINGLTVLWSGLMADGTPPTADFYAVQVHASLVSGFTPDATTLAGHMVGAGAFGIANLIPGATYYVITMVMNNAGNLGPVSNQVLGTPVSVPASIPPGSIQQSQLGFTVSGGGVNITFGTSAPVTPAVNDLWFNTANGNLLSQWNGTTWTAYQWGNGALATGSVTAATILVGTIFAGIVDGTILTGSTIQNSTTNPKTSINPDGSITITNAAGVVVFRIGADGTVYWFSQSGTLLQQISPGGTQLIYASLTGPQAPSNEPNQPVPALALFAATSFGAYANPVSNPTSAGDVLTAIVSCNGATDCTGVTDTQGNTYTLVQSCTAVTPHMQVFQATGATAALTLTGNAGGPDVVTFTMSAANTQQKNFILLNTASLLTVSPLDFSAQATGTSAAPSVSGTPTSYGDTVMLIASWASAGGAGTVVDGFQLVQQSQVAGQQYTSVYFGPSLSGSALTASAAITSAAWCAVIIGYRASPAQTLAANAPVPLNSTVSASSLWGDEGNFSLKVTKSGAGTPWGVTYPGFPVQPGSLIAVRLVVGTLNIALGNFEFGFNWWGGPNGTGANLGATFWTFGAVPFNQFQAVILYNIPVPAGAQSATVYAQEKQADTAGNWFLLDGVHVPGGLAYSNSPQATIDAVGNPVPQGMNFVGLTGMTNAFGVTDPYQGQQLASIDSQGNITGQTLSAAVDVNLPGGSLISDILPNYAQGLVARGWTPGGPWPSTPVGTGNTSILELDQTLTAGRGYRFSVIPTDFIPTNAATQYVMQLRATTDGSTPTTSTPVLRQSVIACTNANLNHMTPICEYIPGNLTSDTLYRLLVTANVQAGTFQYQGSLELRIEDLGNWISQQFVNNGLALGTGSGGGTTVQSYTETFYPANTYSYDQWGQKNHNGSMYQGAYSGSSYDQHSWIVWANGNRGNGLSTVLNYTVQSVTLRLLNLHSWYNSGMTVSLRYGNAGSPGSPSNISAELTSWHINEGQKLTHTIGSADWAAWKTAGRWTVLKAGSTSLDRYGYFYGGGGSTDSMPQLIVKYSH
jgi:hypothetical protein